MIASVSNTATEENRSLSSDAVDFGKYEEPVKHRAESPLTLFIPPLDLTTLHQHGDSHGMLFFSSAWHCVIQCTVAI
jgi:hypothetical protein